MADSVSANEMQDAEATHASSPIARATSKRRSRFWLLLAAHFIVVPFFCIWSTVEGTVPFMLEFVLVIPVFGTVLAQSSLLGVWVAFSQATWWKRLAGMVIGAIVLEIMLLFGAQDDGFTLIAAMATGGIAAVFCLVRWRFADLRSFPNGEVLNGQDGVQFSISGLMLFTLVVAAMIIGAREMRENAPVGPSFFVVSIWSLCFVLTGLAGAWAGLGLARPILRSLFVLLVAAALGGLFAYGINIDDRRIYSYIIPMMLIHAGVLIASLLVVRSCGYRLLRKSVVLPVSAVADPSTPPLRAPR